MNEILDAAQKFGPLVAGLMVPLVGGVLLPLLGLRQGPKDPAAVRSMTRHAKLHDMLPEGARAPLAQLMAFEAAKYSDVMMRRGKRKLIPGAVAGLVLLGLVTAFTVYLLTVIALAWWPMSIGAGIVAGFGIALLVHQAQFVYQYEEGEESGEG